MTPIPNGAFVDRRGWGLPAFIRWMNSVARGIERTTQLLDTITITTPVASFDFLNIPQTYGSLYVTFQGQDTSAMAAGDYYARLLLNADTNVANYDQLQYLIAAGAAATAGNVAPSASGMLSVGCPGVFNNPDAVGGGSILIPGYCSPFYKTVISTFHKTYDTANRSNGTLSFTYKSKAPITQLRLSAQTGSFATGTTCSLFGLP